MGDMKEIGHAQAFQALFRKLDESLGAVTNHIQHPSAQAREPRLDQRLPRGIGPIVYRLFQQEIARREVHTDQKHAFQERFIHGPNNLAHLSARTPRAAPTPPPSPAVQPPTPASPHARRTANTRPVLRDAAE